MPVISPDIEIKHSEAKTIRFTIKDATGVAVDVSDPIEVSLCVKACKDDAVCLVSKANADFDKAASATGVVSVPFSTADTAQDPNDYLAELKIIFSAESVDLSSDLIIRILQSVI